MIKLRPWKGTKNEFEADIIVNGPNGRTLRKRVKAPVTGKSNAERWARSVEQDLLAQLLAPEPEPEQPPAPTFEEFSVIFLDLCTANRRGRNTLINYSKDLRLYLLPALGKRRLDGIKPADIATLQSSMAALSHNSMVEVLKTLRRIFNVAIAQKLIDREPVALEIPKRMRKAVIAYDAREQAALLAAAQAMGQAYVVLVLLGFDAGLRAGEIVGLQWSDLDLERGLLVVRHNIVRGHLDRPKGRTEDEVAVTRRLAQALRELPRLGTFVFAREPDTHYSDQHVPSWMKQLVKRAGIPWLGTHVLRKTCGTRIADGGGGVGAIATHLRHKDLQTASRYIDRRGSSSRAISALEG
ncbi:MAG: tyrosine-type recombinase/integrase [Nannocystis sp.]|nr:site-specific integrase [Nannocystis sp.]MBA3549636.1 tyrosine-type recombinase/integrase [Nannocystis sp.]